MKLTPVRQCLKNLETTALVTHLPSLHLAWCPALWFENLIVDYKGTQSLRRLVLPAFVSLQVDDTDFKQAVIKASF